MSKGSNQRPTDQKKYQDNYEKVFGKKHKKGINEGK